MDWNTASSQGVITVTPGKSNSFGESAAKGAAKLAPKVAGKVGGVVGGLVVSDNEGRSTHEVQVGGQDLTFDHGPGDLYNPVYGRDPATGEMVDTGIVAVPNGHDADGNRRFDLMPQSNLGSYLDGKMARTDIADPMSPAPPSEIPEPQKPRLEGNPIREPEKGDGTTVYPDQSDQSGPTAHVNPDQSDELDPMNILEMAKKRDVKQAEAFARKFGLDPDKTGRALEDMKHAVGMGGESAYLDFSTGDVYDPKSGEKLGNVLDGVQ